MRKCISVFVLLSFVLSACATPPNKVSAAYVSPLVYQDYTCGQIRGELARVSRKVHEVTGHQQKEADGDAVALGVGLVLFWPALFFMMGEDKKYELARLKGEYDALEQTAIRKECDIAEELSEVRRLSEEREAERAQAQREVGRAND